MARTEITSAAIRQIGRQRLSVQAGDFALPTEASDPALGNAVKCTGKEILVMRNTDAGAQTVTIDARPDAYGRDGTITDYSIPAGETHLSDILTEEAFEQDDGMIHINASDALLELGVIRIAG